MDKIETFKEVVQLLNDKEIVFTLNNNSVTYFRIVKDKIQVNATNVSYKISLDDLENLFFKENFYLYDLTEEIVSQEKDDEYYSWKRK